MFVCCKIRSWDLLQVERLRGGRRTTLDGDPGKRRRETIKLRTARNRQQFEFLASTATSWSAISTEATGWWKTSRGHRYCENNMKNVITPPSALESVLMKSCLHSRWWTYSQRTCNLLHFHIEKCLDCCLLIAWEVIIRKKLTRWNWFVFWNCFEFSMSYWKNFKNVFDEKICFPIDSIISFKIISFEDSRHRRRTSQVTSDDVLVPSSHPTQKFLLSQLKTSKFIVRDIMTTPADSIRSKKSHKFSPRLSGVVCGGKTRLVGRFFTSCCVL